MPRWTERDLATKTGKAVKVRKQSASRKTGKAESEIEALLDLQMRGAKLPTPEHNFRFFDGRGFEFDRCWVQFRVGLDIQGNVHRIKSRFEADIEKAAIAEMEGWTFLRVSGAFIRSGVALVWITAILQRAMRKQKQPDKTRAGRAE